MTEQLRVTASSSIIDGVQLSLKYASDYSRKFKQLFEESKIKVIENLLWGNLLCDLFSCSCTILGKLLNVMDNVLFQTSLDLLLLYFIWQHSVTGIELYRYNSKYINLSSYIVIIQKCMLFTYNS